MVDINRREFLRRSGISAGGLAALGGLSALLAACGEDQESGGGSQSASGGEATIIKPKVGLSSTPQATYLPVIAGPILAGTKFGLFVESLDRHPGVELVAVGDSTLRGPSRAVAAALSWRPDRRAWKEHYRKNPLTFQLRSRQSRRWARRRRALRDRCSRRCTRVGKRRRMPTSTSCSPSCAQLWF